MNEAVKKLWVEALKSGEYKQTRGALRKDDSFCCLGVLCDLYAKRQSRAKWLVPSGTPISVYQFYDGRMLELAYLPLDVQEWAELPHDPIVRLPEEGFSTSLSSVNDCPTRDFIAIANLIEGEM